MEIGLRSHLIFVPLCFLMQWFRNTESSKTERKEKNREYKMHIMAG